MDLKKVIKITNVVVLLCFVVAIFSLAGECQMSVAMPVFQKGMTYVTWSPETFAGKKSDESLKAMADAGINYVAIVPTWYQESYNSTEIRPTDRSPSDSSIRHVIKKAHELGMAVLLKPHIDLQGDADSTSRSDIGFQSEDKWNEWCDSYIKFMKHYSRIAEQNDVDILCVGTELAFASERTDMWKDRIIPAIKKIFKGQLTYAANWDEYKSVQFWGDLDYAGIDAYFPLADKANPTKEEIKQGWVRWLSDIESWQKGINKPVIFTELGYCSSDSAPRKPWEESMSGTPNHDMQAECYKAAFETFWNKSWFYGVYWWNWNTYPGSGGEKNRGFTPQNKLALNDIKQWYAKNVGVKLYTGTGSELGQRLGVESSISAGSSQGIVFTGEMAARNGYTKKGEGGP